jgi:hypothetical protein
MDDEMELSSQKITQQVQVIAHREVHGNSCRKFMRCADIP